VYTVKAIHNDSGYKRIRSDLAKQYDFNYKFPEIEISDVDIWGDRTMFLTHKMRDKRALHTESAGGTIICTAYLWGYKVILQSVDVEENQIISEWETDDSPETVE